MASGKSLELKQFDEEHSLKNRRQLLCCCGKVWAGLDHFTVKGKLRKNLPDGCYPTGRGGSVIRQIAANQAKMG